MNQRGPSSADFAEGPARDDVDPELLALPDPPRRERTFTVLLLALTALASVAMVLALRVDAAYAFRSPTPTDLGDLRTAPAASFEANRLVHAEAMLGAAGAIRYEHPFEGDSYRVSPVAGRHDVWVEVRVPAGAENARYVPKGSFTGRLVPLDSAGPRHRGLAASVASATGEAVPEGAWLLVDGEQPADAKWAVALVALFAGFALWNGVAIARLVRRVR
jgi:hypothetical protein